MRKTVLLAALALIITTASFADGGGGMFYGYQVSAYPFLEKYPVRNNSLGLAYFGGYGYGVNRRNNWVTGGFGFAILDVGSDTGVAGGFGGIISGFRLLAAPINISFLSWTGFGGISVGGIDPDGPGGYFAVSEEITVELGLPILPWFMPTVYVGYQIAGNVIPGRAFESFLSYTPVAGLRVQWGDFY